MAMIILAGAQRSGLRSVAKRLFFTGSNLPLDRDSYFARMSTPMPQPVRRGGIAQGARAWSWNVRVSASLLTLFVVVVLSEHVVHPELSPLHHRISEYANTDPS
jgi:hypothetical protein